MKRRIKKLIKWLYKKYVDDFYISDKRVMEVFVKEKGCCANEPYNSVSITQKHIKGEHPAEHPGGIEKYIFDFYGDSVHIWKKNEKD